MSNELYIPEFAQGWLFVVSQDMYVKVLALDDEDYWEVVHDVPHSASEHREYESYDLNIWRDDETGKWHCTAYEIWYDEENNQHTNTDEWVRLW
jgi:hypothetical protein